MFIKQCRHIDICIVSYLLAKGGGLLSTDEESTMRLDSSDMPSDDDGCKIPVDDDADVPSSVLTPNVFLTPELAP